MKTTVTFKSITIIVIMILAATLCFAATHHPKESNDLKKFMEKHVGYPEFAKENSLSGFVVISFEVTKEGRIDLKAINARAGGRGYPAGRRRSVTRLLLRRIPARPRLPATRLPPAPGWWPRLTNSGPID